MIFEVLYSCYDWGKPHWLCTAHLSRGTADLAVCIFAIADLLAHASLLDVLYHSMQLILTTERNHRELLLAPKASPFETMN